MPVYTQSSFKIVHGDSYEIFVCLLVFKKCNLQTFNLTKACSTHKVLIQNTHILKRHTQKKSQLNWLIHTEMIFCYKPISTLIGGFKYSLMI